MSSTIPSALDGLVALARLGRSAPRLEDFLSAVAETAAITAGFRVAAFNLYRPADDDYVVTSVVGSEDAQRALTGTSVPGAWARRIFHEASEIERVYFVPAQSVAWAADDAPPVYLPPIEPTASDEAWHPMDALLAPLASSSGQPLGFLSFDEPIDGRRPSLRRLKALAAVAAQAAITVEQRHDERADAAHSAILTHLIGATPSFSGAADAAHVLDAVEHVLRTAFGFGYVAIDASATAADTLARVRRAVDPVDGTYLLSAAAAEQCCPQWSVPASPGEGSRAFGAHLLLLPIVQQDGRTTAIVRLAQPADRLLPTPERIALLGLLAAQAAAGMEHAAQQHLRTERDRAQHLARHDEATGLPNRLSLTTALESRRAAGAISTVLALDFEDVGLVREALGHDHGEATLRAVALRLERLTGPGRVYRLDSEVLGILLDDTIDQALRLADRCLRALSTPLEVARTEHRVNGCVGIAAVAGLPAETLRHADVARVRARRERRAVVVYDAASDDAAFRLARVSALRAAPGRGELELHYQPIVDAHSAQITGLEALVRWRQGGRLIPPLEWIGLAESSGLIERIGAWVVDAAAAQSRAWTDAGLIVPPINVNVAPRQLRGGQLAATIGRALDLHGVDPSALIVELTESGLQPGARVNDELTALAELGIRTAVDDFGADYSSLSRLRELPVSMLKIDRAFLREVPTDPRAVDLLRAIMGLGSALGVQVVVEGVEQPAQAAFLADSGTPVFWQGFLRSRPLPAMDLGALLPRRGAGA